MIDANQPCDIVTLAEKLARDGHLADAGGMEYLRVISQATNTTANIAAYADLVRDMAIMRAMLSAAGEQVADVYQPEGRKAGEITGGGADAAGGTGGTRTSGGWPAFSS